MFENARAYNQPETMYFKYANELEDYILPHLNALKDGSLEINMPDFRRNQNKNARSKKTLEKN